MWRATFLLGCATLFSACVFDTSGPPPYAGIGTETADLADGVGIGADLGGVEGDSPPPLDGPVPAAAPTGKPDLQAKGNTPVTLQALLQQWSSTQVPCVDRNGATKGAPIGIIDSGLVLFVDGQVTLQQAPVKTKMWVGNRSSVTVVWDPNACVGENPFEPNGSWEDAGLLVRGASLDALGRLVLEPWVSVQDIDLIDVAPDGSFEGKNDFCNPQDFGLSGYPQLVGPVQAAKAGILAAAKGP
jgi:hypothetical protein